MHAKDRKLIKVGDQLIIACTKNLHAMTPANTKWTERRDGDGKSRRRRCRECARIQERVVEQDQGENGQRQCFTREEKQRWTKNLEALRVRVGLKQRSEAEIRRQAPLVQTACWNDPSRSNSGNVTLDSDPDGKPHWAATGGRVGAGVELDDPGSAYVDEWIESLSTVRERGT